jgi:cation diffusion facilitator family transporter
MSKVKNTAHFSLLVSLIVLALKYYAYTQTNSTAILSDAMETIANVITALVAIMILGYAMAPADEDHPYGHGKLEYFSAAFEGGIILFAALAILFESFRVLFIGSEPRNLIEGAVYILLATAFNLFVGMYLKKVGREQNSEALKASGAHLLADVKTTAGVIVGLCIFKLTGLWWVDPMVGLCIGVWLCYESLQIIQRNIGGLLDQTDPNSVKTLTGKINLHVDENIIDIHNLRIIRSGNFHHIDAHLVVPEFLDVKTVHELIEKFEEKVVRDYRFDGEFAFHTDPCYKNYCRVCPQSACSVRVSDFKSRRIFSEEHIVKGPQYTE